MGNPTALGTGIYWTLFFCVLGALAGGAAAGRFAPTAARALGACAGLAALICCVAIYLSSQAGYPEFWPLLCVAALMFSLVMSAATALVARRVRRAHGVGR